MDKWDERVYKHYATAWDLPPLEPGAMKQFDWKLLESIGGVKDRVVLNEGCHYPVDELQYGREAKEWIGIDFVEEAIEKAKKLVSYENVKLMVCDMRDLPFASEYFDIVLSFSSIDHVKRGRPLVQKEAFRVLKPGGYYLITVPNVLYPEFEQESDEFGYWYSYSPQELKEELEEAGFVVLSFRDIDGSGTGARIGCVCEKEAVGER